MGKNLYFLVKLGKKFCCRSRQTRQGCCIRSSSELGHGDPHSFIYLGTHLPVGKASCALGLRGFASFQGLAACLPFVAQFPDEIIILWLLCPFPRGFKTEPFTGLAPEAGELMSCSRFPLQRSDRASRVQKSRFRGRGCGGPIAALRPRDPGTEVQVPWEAVGAAGPGLSTSDSGLGIKSLFLSPAH